jgi:hypothetical protein
LSGPTSATPKGTTYAYDERGRRMTLLMNFVARTDVAGKIFHTMDCNNADICQVQ